jgi:hypothetical protein
VRDAKKIGLSRRELEWTVQGMLRQAPADPAALARLIADMMVTLMERNNAAIARALGARDEADDDRSGRF